jgi:hypothetical protein
MTRWIPLPLAALLCAAPAPAQDHDHAHGHPAAAVGRVAMPTSCAPEAHERFETGLAMLHSFWFEAAERVFREAAAADPTCPMPHWGVAMTRLGNPFTGSSPGPEALAEGLAAAQAAVRLATDPREAAYARAALALYAGHQATPYRERMLAHEAALRELAAASADDPEAAIFLARALIANAPPSDLTYARQLEAAAILEPLSRDHPDHPGLAHYTIHAFDAPTLALHGLDAARRYAGIAPDAPHALHMPSHIFTRLGYWDESIEVNLRSAAAEPNPDAAVHPMDYLVYAYLQQGRDGSARSVVERAVQNPDRYYGGILGYNFAAMPARLALERGRWQEAAALRVPPAGPAYVRAINHFARAVGAARGGAPHPAGVDARALAALRDTLAAAGETYWATVVDAQRLAAEAWIAHAAGRGEDARRLAGEAAALEETVEKHPVTPGPLLPARELFGDLLLEHGDARGALEAYRATLRREPNRARALFGAARAADAA